MGNSICGTDCEKCAWKHGCAGCSETGGKPFGGDCVLAGFCKNDGGAENLKARLIAAFNDLHIDGMDEVKDLNALKGSYINLEYALPCGEKIRLWEDNRVYLGNQLCKKNSERCYGIAADERYLAVSEYGENGSDPELVVFKRWNDSTDSPKTDNKTAKTLVIRHAEPDDADMILRCDRHISPEELRRSIGAKRVFIAERERVFCGWLRYNLFWDNTPFMNMLTVLPAFRRTGIGKQLVAYWENEMRAAGFLRTMTSTQATENARYFYVRLGYTECGGFYPDGEEYELIFKKQL